MLAASGGVFEECRCADRGGGRRFFAAVRMTALERAGLLEAAKLRVVDYSTDAGVRIAEAMQILRCAPTDKGFGGWRCAAARLWERCADLEVSVL
jgi:hypothetical protein